MCCGGLSSDVFAAYCTILVPNSHVQNFAGVCLIFQNVNALQVLHI